MRRKRVRIERLMMCGTLFMFLEGRGWAAECFMGWM